MIDKMSYDLGIVLRDALTLCVHDLQYLKLPHALSSQIDEQDIMKYRVDDWQKMGVYLINY